MSVEHAVALIRPSSRSRKAYPMSRKQSLSTLESWQPSMASKFNVSRIRARHQMFLQSM
jgi:hypothetical protein